MTAAAQIHHPLEEWVSTTSWKKERLEAEQILCRVLVASIPSFYVA
jgi:hypothetical protein